MVTESSTDRLFKGKFLEEIDRVERLFLLGNGIIHEGNLPLQQAINKFINNFSSSFSKSLENGGISSLCRISALERQLLDTFFVSLMSLKKIKDEEIKSAEFEELKKLEDLMCFRSYLAVEYSDKKIIGKEKVFLKLQENHIDSENSFVVTTNWDNVLWENNKIQNLLHLHGRCEDHSTLIFPTETIAEKYFRWYMCYELIDSFSKIENSGRNVLRRCHVDIAEYKKGIKSGIAEVREVEKKFKNCLTSAEIIIVCGLAFNDYDHELMNAISESVSNKKIKKILFLDKLDQTDQERRNIKNKKAKLAKLFHFSENEIEFIETTD